jgi:two-component system KDP operon response regulator KdpE
MLTESTAKTILIVDDEPGQLKMFAQLLFLGGYNILKASSGREAVSIVQESTPDLVLLDVVMPEIDGWQTCRLIRDISGVPIIMLSGVRYSEGDIVHGLESGADEYLVKPISNRELLARVKAVFRRTDELLKTKSVGAHFSDGYLSVSVPERKVTVNGKATRLTNHEFRILLLLMENAGRVLTHQQLLEVIWGSEYINDVDYVRVYISHLRQKIEPTPAMPQYILTETGVGYFFRSNS